LSAVSGKTVKSGCASISAADGIGSGDRLVRSFSAARFVRL